MADRDRALRIIGQALQFERPQAQVPAVAAPGVGCDQHRARAGLAAVLRTEGLPMALYTDRAHWAFHTPKAKGVPYRPTCALCFRSLKALKITRKDTPISATIAVHNVA